MEIKEVRPNNSVTKIDNLPARSIKGTTMVKKSSFDRFVDCVLPNDCPDFKTLLETRTETIITKIIFPRLKTLLVDIVATYLGSSPTAKQIATNVITAGIQRVDYTKPSASQNRSTVSTSPLFNSNIAFSTADDAEGIRQDIIGLMNRQGYVTMLQYIGHINACCGTGIETSSEMDGIGWTTMSSSRIEKQGDSWVLVMPRPIILEKR